MIVSALAESPPVERQLRTDAFMRPFLVFLALCLCTGIFFRCYHLDRKVLWEDELFATVHLLGHTEAEIVAASGRLADAAAFAVFFQPSRAPGGLLANVRLTVASLAAEDPQHPPLYYALAHVWARMFGTSPAALRGLALLFGLIALPLMYYVARELFGSRRAGLLAVAIIAVSPFHVLYAQEVREYSLWTVTTLLMSLTFLRAQRRPSFSAWAWFAVAFSVSLYVYPMSGLVGLGFGACLALAHGADARRAFGGGVAAIVAGFALFAPWLSIMLHSGGLKSGMAKILGARPGKAAVLFQFARDIRGAFIDLGLFRVGAVSSTAINMLVTILVLALVGYALAVVARSSPRRVSLFIILGLCAPTCVLALNDLLRGSELTSQTRYFTPLYVGIELAVAQFFALMLAPAQRWAPAWRAAFGALMLGGILSCAVSSQAATWASKDYEQNRDVAALVNAAPAPVVVSDFHTARTLGLAYYLAPSVELRLDLHCDQCSVVGTSRGDLLAGVTAGHTVFLVGPSAQLADSARKYAARGGTVRTIGVVPFGDRGDELSMFAPTR